MSKQTPPFDINSAAAKGTANLNMLVTGVGEGFDNPVTRTEYEIFCVCNDVKSLTDKFDSNEGIEAFFTQQAADDLNLAAARLASIVETITTRKIVT